MAYRTGEIMRLNEVKELGIDPTSILDIGAHSGQFYGWAKPVWPNSVIWVVEANPLHEETLRNITQFTNDNYLISALGDEEREVTFYTRKDKPWTEGNSYYKELNYWDIPQLVQENTTKLQKLDNIFTGDTVFELIKIDTQGSELDILKGGKNLCKKASVIILEVSYIEYNEKSPTADEVIKFMKDFGFEEKMSIGEHYIDDEIVQKDIVFLNKNI
jgi:FkbM family methyltransferase|tara:strand:- start:25 stop:672 length:648 start_codon:yes stop_codon:yes gene_type:complete